MSAPTGSLFPNLNDSSTNIGSSVATGNLITAAYANTQSSAILQLESLLGPDPGVVAWKPAVRLATAGACRPTATAPAS